MRIPCQQRYPGGRSCRRWTHGEGEYCRWHRILHEFRADYAGKPSWMSQTMMFGLYGSVGLAGWAFFQFSRSPDVLWLLVAVYGVGSTAKVFADGILARDAPLSQFAFWAQLLALGLLLEIGAGAAAVWRVVADPVVAEPLVRLAGNDPRWVAAGPRVVVVVAAVEAALSTELFLSRIAFLTVPKLRTAVWLLAGLALSWALSPFLRRLAPAPTPEARTAFWAPVLGTSSTTGLAIAYFAGFMLCEFVNVGIRRAPGDPELFRKTLFASFFACVLPPLVGMLVSRYLLLWLGISGTAPFVIATLVLAIPLCVVGTRTVIRRAEAAS